ncbi:hypothetical protein HanIR_Chr16g0821741 [Helianthus annuus]|nr:hypothetical protein HanIR_Chr16g0821741 [Helianthus annuus]
MLHYIFSHLSSLTDQISHHRSYLFSASTSSVSRMNTKPLLLFWFNDENQRKRPIMLPLAIKICSRPHLLLRFLVSSPPASLSSIEYRMHGSLKGMVPVILNP